jgi:prepilin peptidase dependent protein B
MLMKHKGFSLVELLLALLLGMLLLAMVIGLYVSTVANGAKSLKYSRLRTDLQSIMSLIETDIRRAGYGGEDFLVASGGTQTIDSFDNCIVYAYDYDYELKQGFQLNNRMGFRFNSDENEIQFGTGVNALASNCYNEGNWVALSDKQFIKITALNFNVISTVNTTETVIMRSVEIDLAGELTADGSYKHAINTKVQVRNLEFND